MLSSFVSEKYGKIIYIMNRCNYRLDDNTVHIGDNTSGDNIIAFSKSSILKRERYSLKFLEDVINDVILSCCSELSNIEAIFKHKNGKYCVVLEKDVVMNYIGYNPVQYVKSYHELQYDVDQYTEYNDSLIIKTKSGDLYSISLDDISTATLITSGVKMISSHSNDDFLILYENSKIALYDSEIYELKTSFNKFINRIFYFQKYIVFESDKSLYYYNDNDYRSNIESCETYSEILIANNVKSYCYAYHHDSGLFYIACITNDEKMFVYDFENTFKDKILTNDRIINFTIVNNNVEYVLFFMNHNNELKYYSSRSDQKYVNSVDTNYKSIEYSQKSNSYFVI